MTDITELAQNHELRNKINHRLYGALEFQGTSGEHATVTLSIDECKSIIAAMDERLALAEALEKAQTINAAAEKLVRCKGRYHSEQNYRALAALFGVTTPDLPPLEHENVHYADAAEMEIAALRQRIAELEESNAQVIQSRDHYKRMTEEGLRQLAESRTVKLPKPHAHLIWIQAGHAPDDYWDDVAVSHSEKDRCCDGSERYPVYARWEIEEMLAANGIKVEAE
ncbi:ead/Ea22-like family protein [Klebsiella quasipneumoniae]|uniref:ead/Ea22-like family protein n=1 Tax=Klebsiella quasipneumoniae TaxID=1463165 RepID=UPI0010E95A85|nr:ead/Ea22-like family protein [Klebsiella quasipneumoniae]VFZ40369.1 Ead domain protein [Klebsiella quasipneumoniae]